MFVYFLLQRSQNEVEEDGDHGGLVKKILETKKELEGGNKAPQAAAGKRKDSVSNQPI